MKHFTIDIKVDGSLNGSEAYFFGHDITDSLAIRVRPVIIICPGGGYEYTSDREADIVAFQFLAMGYNSIVLRYSCAPSGFPVSLLELGKLVKTIHENASSWGIDPDKIYVLGFSAGGHLASSYSSLRNEEFVRNALNADVSELDIIGQILCYPVITSGEYAHVGSFDNLIGEDNDRLRKMLSVENIVNEFVPRTFIWNTLADPSVPAMNSLLYVNALVKAGVPVEYHLFEKGGHGLSLGNKLTSPDGVNRIEESVTPWIELVHTWIGRF